MKKLHKTGSVRLAFGARLRQAMIAKGYIAKRGAKSGVDVGPLFAAAGVTREQARRYVNGDVLPDEQKIKAICTWLNVPVIWLRDGIDPARLQLIAKNDLDNHNRPVPISLPASRSVPLRDWDVASLKIDRIGTSDSTGGGMASVSIEADASVEAFALKVQGDSMYDAATGAGFPAGCIIIVDPKRQPKSGSYIVADTERGGELSFKQLIVDGDQQLLKPVNPRYPIVRADANMRLIGVVIEKTIRELFP